MSAITWQQAPDRCTWRAAAGVLLLTVTKLGDGKFAAMVEGPGVTERSPDPPQYAAGRPAVVREPRGRCTVNRKLPRWPLYLIALPAAVAVWSGWVGLGTLCGFGIIHPLPGIWDAATVNTAITLPIGVEAYGAYAMGAWLSPGVPESARRFAKWSAIGSLALGMLGQVAYHLLSAAHAVRAPWPVVVLVSSLPVVVLGFGAALTHLLRDAPEPVPVAAPVSAPEPLPAPVPESALEGAPDRVPDNAHESTSKIAPKSAPGVKPQSAAKRTAKAKQADPVDLYAAELASGEVPSLRRIRADMHVGQDKAKTIQTELTALLVECVPVAA